jgi:hypothetical protein
MRFRLGLLIYCCLGLAGRARAAPRPGVEAGVQAGRAVLDTGPAVGLPLSGFVTVVLPVWSKDQLGVVAGLGYDDATYRNRIDVTDFDNVPDPDRVKYRLRSVVVPVHLEARMVPHVAAEFGAEWRILLQERETTYRQDGLIAPRRYSGMEGFRRSALALSSGIQFQWRGWGGHPRVALRWVEGVTHILQISEDFTPGAAQLALAWRP